MSQDAKVEIWVGVRNDEADIDDIIAKLPDDLFDQYGNPFYDDEKVKGIVDRYGCYPEKFVLDDYEKGVGFGISVFHHDWDYGIAPFYVEELQEKIIRAKEDILHLFQRFGIQYDVGVWCQTMYD